MRARLLLFLSALALLLAAPVLGAAAAQPTGVTDPIAPTSVVTGLGASQASGETTAPPPGEQDDADEGDGTAVRGTLRDAARQGVEGVIVTVSQDGTEVATGTTEENGAWLIPLPAAGSYDVAIDTEALPEGTTLRNEAQATQSVTVEQGRPRGVNFALVGDGSDGTEAAGPRTALDRVPQLAVEGIRYGAIIAITAVGLSLVFGTTRMINFAHGEYVTIGAVAAFWLSTSPGSLPLILAAVLAMVVGAAVAGGLELGLWRPMRRRNTGLIQLFIVSIGLSLLLRHLILVLFGPQRERYADYATQTQIRLGPIGITPRDLVITLVAIAVLLAVAYMLRRTRIGTAMRAVADNRDLAQASGIDVERVVLVVWLLGGGLAALGGVLFGLAQRVYWDMGFTLLLLMFAGVILGGLGSAFGAIIGSLVVGLVYQMSSLWSSSAEQPMWALLVLILVLLVRPQGILGRAERAG